jgi:hypothetical protein
VTDEELKALFEALEWRTDNAHVETRRHFDVSLESVRHEIRLVAYSTSS